MADNRPIWFSMFVLVVLFLGFIGGYRVGTHMRPPPPDGPGLFDGPGGGPGRGGRRGGPPPLFGRGPGGPGGPGGLGGPGGPPPPSEIVNRLTSELELDATQQGEVTKILTDRRDRLDAIHRDARERFEKEQRDIQAAIRLVLKPEQQVKFDKFLDRRPR
jgi:hypothetical protein